MNAKTIDASKINRIDVIDYSASGTWLKTDAGYERHLANSPSLGPADAPASGRATFTKGLDCRKLSADEKRQAIVDFAAEIGLSVAVDDVMIDDDDDATWSR